MKPLIILSALFLFTAILKGQTALEIRKVKNGKTVVIPEGKMFAFNEAQKRFYFVHKKGRLIKAENGIIEYRKGKEVRTIEADKIVMIGHRSFLTYLSKIRTYAGGYAVSFPTLPGSAFQMRNVRNGSFELNLIKQ